MQGYAHLAREERYHKAKPKCVRMTLGVVDSVEAH